MYYMYLICFIIAVGMLFWLKMSDVRKSTIQFINLLIIVISNLGYFCISISSNVEEAILAQKIAYTGAIFLPAFYFLLVLELCHIEIHNNISAALILIQCAIYGVVCTIGRSTLFYTSVEMQIYNGSVYLTRTYGPLHWLYIFSMFGYLAACFVVMIYALRNSKLVDRKDLIIVVVFSALAVLSYIAQKIIHFKFEIMPAAFDALMFGALFPIYNTNLFSIYDNREIINELMEKTAYLSLNTRKVYKGCNAFMLDIYPELGNLQKGQKIRNCSEELQELVNRIDPLDELYKNSQEKEHLHVRIEPFWLGDKCYEGMVHILTNAFGVLKGYTIELRDDTADRQIIEIKENYNEKLTNEVEEKTLRIKMIQQKTILGMAQMVESRDLSTGGHIKRTSDVVRIFANRLLESDYGLDKRFLKLVIRSAPMHDLGKIGVDDAILRKQGRFTDEEYNVMKTHSEIGYRMVGEILSEVEEPDFVEVAKNVAHYHHEKVNGKGYPCGLKGDEIPIEARIMALADVFDALVSKRCYKDAFSYDKAFSIIESDAGEHFDAGLAKEFIACRAELEEYYNNSNE